MRRVFAVAIVAGLATLFLWACSRSRTGEAAEKQAEVVKIPPRVRRTPAGDAVVTLDAQAQARAGLKTEALATATLPQEIQAFGDLQEDPSQSFTLRAPVAGTLRRSTTRDWPGLGQTLADGSVVGTIEPRLAPVDRVNLTERLTSARAEVAATSASLVASRAALVRARTLNAEDKNVSDRALQEAEARVKGEEARLGAAAESARLIESALATAAPVALGVERGGQVVEVLAQPDEAVESGQPILRVARFNQFIARVDVPAGQAVPGSVSTAQIVPIGHEERLLRGERVSLAAAVDPKTQGQPFLFRIRDPGLNLRPGMAVTAHLNLPGAPRRGALIPRSALVRFAGAAWVYVQLSAGEFSRREVALDRPAEKGWFSASLKPGEHVVVAGAQTLLSEELKFQIQVGEEEAKH
jgi:hypothetical protein